MLSTIICISSATVSFYTTKLIIDSTKNDADFCITLKKYFGNCGYYTGIIAPAFLMLGTLTALYILLADLSYPILLSLYVWVTPSEIHPEALSEPTFQ